MTEFSIRRVDRTQSQSVEPLGSKPKFWFREGRSRLLFKADDRGTGEDWAEVIACHLCRMLGLPCIGYELATECDKAVDIRPGVVCENMAPPPVSLVLGNELLLARDPQYPREQRFKVRQHTVEAVSDTISTLAAPPDAWMTGAPTDVKSAMDVFAGYVMVDAWIANQDRHHENWGALSDGEVMRLAPTFDHGAALARNLLDSEREERLTTKDKNRTVAAFARRGRSAFYGSATDARPLELCEAFVAFAKQVPGAGNAWLRRLRDINVEAIQDILERVPKSRMSETSKRFTRELADESPAIAGARKSKMNSLFVAWRPATPEGAGWRPVGRLEYDGQLYRFCYTRGAQKPGFRPFPQMQQMGHVYEAVELFPLFANRLLSASRPEYEDYLRWSGFDAAIRPDPIVILSVTEGLRQTDAVEVFPCPALDASGCYFNKFFLHGIRWLPEAAIDRIDRLAADEPLRLMLDLQNDHDRQAVAVRTENERTQIGYVPRYLAHDVWQLVQQCDTDFIKLFVDRVNRDAPLQNRLLCRMHACWPDGFRPCAGDDFVPIPADISAICDP